MLEKSDGMLRIDEYVIYVSRTAPILATPKAQAYIITDIISISHIKKKLYCSPKCHCHWWNFHCYFVVPKIYEMNACIVESLLSHPFGSRPFSEKRKL